MNIFQSSICYSIKSPPFLNPQISPPLAVQICLPPRHGWLGPVPPLLQPSATCPPCGSVCAQRHSQSGSTASQQAPFHQFVNITSYSLSLPQTKSATWLPIWAFDFPSNNQTQRGNSKDLQPGTRKRRKNLFISVNLQNKYTSRLSFFEEAKHNTIWQDEGHTCVKN